MRTVDALCDQNGRRSPTSGFEPARPGQRGSFPKVDRAYYLARMSGQQLQASAEAQRRRRIDTSWMTNPTH